MKFASALLKPHYCGFRRVLNYVKIFLQFPHAYGHTTLKTRHPVRSVKLSNVGPGQYLDRRRPGNPRCCKQSLFYFSLRNRLFNLSVIHPQLSWFIHVEKKGEEQNRTKAKKKKNNKEENLKHFIFNFASKTLHSTAVLFKGCSHEFVAPLEQQSVPKFLFKPQSLSSEPKQAITSNLGN